jgi:hypothetical protein
MIPHLDADDFVAATKIAESAETENSIDEISANRIENLIDARVADGSESVSKTRQNELFLDGFFSIKDGFSESCRWLFLLSG